MCTERLPQCSEYIQLINLPKSQLVQVKNKFVQLHFKAPPPYEFTTNIRNKCFRGFGPRKGGLFCFLWPENPGQATVLDVSVNFNWLTEQWDSLGTVHKFDSHARNADSCCWSVTDGEKWFSTHPKPPCPSTVHPGMKDRFASADSEHVYMFVMTRLNAVFEKCAESKSCLGPPWA